MAVDYITLTQLIDEMITIVRDTAGTGAAIETFTQAEYSATTKCFDHPDAYNAPGEGDVPFVAFYRNRHAMGESVSQWVYEIEAELGIVDDTQNTTDPNITKQNGMIKLEAYKDLVYDAIRQNIPCNANIDVSDWEPDGTTHPLYVGYLTFVINIPKVIGGVIGL